MQAGSTAGAERGAVAGAPSTCAGRRLQSHGRRHSRDSSEAEEITSQRAHRERPEEQKGKGSFTRGISYACVRAASHQSGSELAVSVLAQVALSSVPRVGTSSSPAAESASVPETESSQVALSTSGRSSGASWPELHLVTVPGM